MANQPNSKEHATPAQVRATALNLLARREHSLLELHHKLTRRGFASETVTTVLERLLADDLVNERRYAELYANSRIDKGYGPLRIRAELRERGISDEIVTVVLADLADFWMKKLIQVHRKRFDGVVPANASDQAKQMRFLRHRGFTLEQIKHLFQTS